MQNKCLIKMLMMCLIALTISVGSLTMVSSTASAASTVSHSTHASPACAQLDAAIEEVTRHIDQGEAVLAELLSTGRADPQQIAEIRGEINNLKAELNGLEAERAALCGG
jgi:Skp family chaperone for outer membrane proteins